MNSPQDEAKIGFLDLVGLIALVARGFAVTVELFLHRSGSFGERYPGIPGAIGFLAILFFPLFWPGVDCSVLADFFLLYLGMAVWVRIRILLRRVRKRGHRLHSYYNGTPRLSWLLRSMREETIKTLVEPGLVFLVGAALFEWSPPMGSYLMTAAGGLLVSSGLAQSMERQRALDMHDSLIEQRSLVERFHEYGGR